MISDLFSTLQEKDCRSPSDSRVSSESEDKDLWEDFHPSSHPRDQRAGLYEEKVDDQGFVTPHRKDKILGFSKSQKREIQDLLTKPRKYGEGSYTWIDFLRYLRHQQIDDKHGEKIFGNQIKLNPDDRKCRISPIVEVIIIGSKFRETLHRAGYLFRMQQKLLGKELERHERTYHCQDYDVRIVFEIRNDIDLERIKSVVQKYFRSCLGDEAIGKDGGWIDAMTRYHMYSVKEEGDLETEWLLVDKLKQEHLCSEDQLQGEISGLENGLPTIRLKGNRQEIFQAIVDTDLGIQRFHEHEKADYYAWIRLIINRSFGKVLQFYPGQSRQVEYDLLMKTIPTGILSEKLYKSAKGGPDHILATYCNVALSLRIHDVNNPYIENQHWNNCRLKLKDQEIQNPQLAAVWRWLQEEVVTFDELIVIMQMVAFLKASEDDEAVTVRKDGGLPVFFWDFGHDATIVFPIITAETIQKYQELVVSKKPPLDELFQLNHEFKLDQFFEEFADRIGLKAVVVRDLGCSLLNRYPEFGLACLKISRLLDSSLKFGYFVRAPEILMRAEKEGRLTSVYPLTQDLFDEGIPLDSDFMTQYVLTRLTSPVRQLSDWAKGKWVSWDLDMQMTHYPRIIKKLRAADATYALHVVKQIGRKKGIRFLEQQASRFRDWEWELIELIFDITKTLDGKFLRKVVKKLEKNPGLLSAGAFDVLVCECGRKAPELIILLIKIFKERDAKDSFFERYPHLEEPFLVQMNQQTKFDPNRVALLSENPRWIERCHPYCTAAFESSPKKWMDLLQKNPSYVLYAITCDFLIKKTTKNSKGMFSLWKQYVNLVGEKQDHASMLSIAEELKPYPQLHPLIISLEVDLLKAIRGGEITTYDEVKKASELVLSTIPKKLPNGLLKAWRESYTAILQVLYNHNPPETVHYWMRSVTHIGLVENALDLLVTCCQEERQEELENFLLSAFHRLSVSQREWIVPAAIKKRIEKKDKEGVVKICRIGGEILGERAKCLQSLVKHEDFDRAIRCLQEEAKLPLLWQELIQKLVDEGKCREALALLLQKLDLFEDCYDFIPIVKKMAFDETLGSSPSAIWDLFDICHQKKIFDVDIYDRLISYVSHETSYHRDHLSIHQFFWDALITEIFVDEFHKEFFILDKIGNQLIHTHPEYYFSSLENLDVLRSMQRLGYLPVYWRNLIGTLGQAHDHHRPDLILKLARSNAIFDNTIFDVYGVQVFTFALLDKDTHCTAFDILKWRLVHKPLTQHESVQVVSALLSLSEMTKDMFVLFQKVCSHLTPDSDALDLIRLFTCLFHGLNRHGLSHEWSLMSAFLFPALLNPTNFDKDFFEAVTNFFVLSITYEGGCIFQRFIDEILQSDYCHESHWVIFIDTLCRIPEDGNVERLRDLERFSKEGMIPYFGWKTCLPAEKRLAFCDVIFNFAVQLVSFKEIDIKYFMSWLCATHIFFDSDNIRMQNHVIQSLHFHKKDINDKIHNGDYRDVSHYDQIMDCFDAELSVYFPMFFDNLGMRINSCEGNGDNELWLSLTKTFHITLTHYPKNISCVLSAFLEFHSSFLKAKYSLSQDVKKELLRILVNAACMLMIQPKTELNFEEIIETIDCCFCSDDDPEIKNLMMLELQHHLSEISLQYQSDRIHLSRFQFAVGLMEAFAKDLFAKHLKNKSVPNESEMLAYLFFSVDMKVDEQENTDKDFCLIPDEWHHCVSNLLTSEHPMVTHLSRMLCLAFLKSHSHFADHYAAFLEITLDKIRQDPCFELNTKSLGALNTYCLQSLESLIAQKKKNSRLDVYRLVRMQVEFLIILFENLKRRNARHVRYCDAVGFDPMAQFSSLLPSDPYQVEARKITIKLMQEFSLMFKITCTFLENCIPCIWFFQRFKKRSVTFHHEVITLLNLLLECGHEEILNSGIFFRTVLNLVTMQSDKKTIDKYYNLLRELMNLTVVADERRHSTKTFNQFLSIFSRYEDYLRESFVEPDLRAAIKRAASGFMQSVFGSFWTRDFKDHEEEILKHLRSSPDENLRNLQNYLS